MNVLAAVMAVVSSTIVWTVMLRRWSSSCQLNVYLCCTDTRATEWHFRGWICVLAKSRVCAVRGGVASNQPRLRLVRHTPLLRRCYYQGCVAYPRIGVNRRTPMV